MSHFVATTFDWLPTEIDLGFAGISALMTGTIAVALVWPVRLVTFMVKVQRNEQRPDVRFETLAVLSSGAAALGAVIGLVFTIVGAATQ